MKHVFGVNKDFNARREAERQREREEEEAFEREEEAFEREQEREFERERRERREARNTSSILGNSRRRSLGEISKANAIVETAINSRNPQRGLILYRRALSIYIPALKKKMDLSPQERSVLMQNTKHAMESAERLKQEIIKSRRGVVEGKFLYFNGGVPEYAWLDNIACQGYPVKIDGFLYPSTEHYFQSQKFAGSDLEHTIRTTLDPMEAKRLGHSEGLRADWENVKIDIMLKAVAAKFEQHESLRMKLVDTSPLLIVEHTKDTCWGDGIDGSGKNLLGKALTAVRNSIVKSARSRKNIAILELHRAIDADRNKNFHTALTLYASGIKDYLDASKDLPSSERKAGFSLVNQCINRAKDVKRMQENQTYDVPVVPASLVQFIPNATAPTLPVARIISDSNSEKF